MADDVTLPQTTDEENKWAAARARNEENGRQTEASQHLLDAGGSIMKALARGGSSSSPFASEPITKADSQAYSKDLELKHRDYAENHLDE